VTPEWILAIAAIVTVLGTLAGVMLKFSKSVDRNTMITEQIASAQSAQWKHIDELACTQEDHGTRLVKIETRLDYAAGAPK
jgi:Tfp pilus assembly protein PilN